MNLFHISAGIPGLDSQTWDSGAEFVVDVRLGEDAAGQALF